MNTNDNPYAEILRLLDEAKPYFNFDKWLHDLPEKPLLPHEQEFVREWINRKH